MPDDAFLKLKDLLVEERGRRKAAERLVERLEQEIITLRTWRANKVNRTAELARRIHAEERRHEQVRQS